MDQPLCTIHKKNEDPGKDHFYFHLPACNNLVPGTGHSQTGAGDLPVYADGSPGDVGIYRLDPFPNRCHGGI